MSSYNKKVPQPIVSYMVTMCPNITVSNQFQIFQPVSNHIRMHIIKDHFGSFLESQIDKLRMLVGTLVQYKVPLYDNVAHSIINLFDSIT